MTIEAPASNRTRWEALARAAAGTSLDTLVSTSQDGLRVGPLHERRTDTHAIAARPAALPWAVVQRVDHPDPVVAAELVLADLANGATGLSLVFAGAPLAFGWGLPAEPDALRRALDGVYLETGIPVSIEAGRRSRTLAFALTNLVAERGLDPSDTSLRFGLDPIGRLAATGIAPASREIVRDRFVSAVSDLAGRGFSGPFARADGRIVHAAGGTEAQELAFVLTTALAYWRALEGPLGFEAAAEAIEFRLAADSDQFLTMAKFRAVRLLWGRLCEAAGLPDAKPLVTAETAWRDLTRLDPWTNLLRSTIATFSAGVAGADEITVLPFTLASGLPDAFARRLARNTQLVLIEEANVHRVADPAAGSGGLEALTDGLATQAWAIAQDIERSGGIHRFVASGELARQVTEAAARRREAIASGKATIVGVTRFRAPNERPVDTLAATPAPMPPTVGEVVAPALVPLRLAEAFETQGGPA